MNSNRVRGVCFIYYILSPTPIFTAICGAPRRVCITHESHYIAYTCMSIIYRYAQSRGWIYRYLYMIIYLWYIGMCGDGHWAENFVGVLNNRANKLFVYSWLTVIVYDNVIIYCKETNEINVVNMTWAILIYIIALYKSKLLNHIVNDIKIIILELIY